jgi:membrane associated rhomboid family serine protease
MTEAGELTIWRFLFLAFITFVVVRAVVDTVVVPINWNWEGVLVGGLIFSILFAFLLKYREAKRSFKEYQKRLRQDKNTPQS